MSQYYLIAYEVVRERHFHINTTAHRRNIVLGVVWLMFQSQVFHLDHRDILSVCAQFRDACANEPLLERMR
jgi:hypothetical protein